MKLWIKRFLLLALFLGIIFEMGIALAQGYFRDRFGFGLDRRSSPGGFWLYMVVWGFFDLYVLKKLVDLF